MATPYATKRQLDVVNTKVEEVKKTSVDEKKVQELIDKTVLTAIRKEY